IRCSKFFRGRIFKEPCERRVPSERRRGLVAGITSWRCCPANWAMRSRYEKLKADWPVRKGDWNKLELGGYRDPHCGTPMKSGRRNYSRRFFIRPMSDVGPKPE